MGHHLVTRLPETTPTLPSNITKLPSWTNSTIKTELHKTAYRLTLYQHITWQWNICHFGNEYVTVCPLLNDHNPFTGTRGFLPCGSRLPQNSRGSSPCFLGKSPCFSGKPNRPTDPPRGRDNFFVSDVASRWLWMVLLYHDISWYIYHKPQWNIGSQRLLSSSYMASAWSWRRTHSASVSTPRWSSRAARSRLHSTSVENRKHPQFGWMGKMGKMGKMITCGFWIFKFFGGRSGAIRGGMWLMKTIYRDPITENLIGKHPNFLTRYNSFTKELGEVWQHLKRGTRLARSCLSW